MAARLPDSLNMSAPRGQRPPSAQDSRELAQGLNAAIEGAGVMFAKKADAEASAALMKFQTDFQTKAAERAAAYDGSAPGFAQAEAERFETELKAFEQKNVGRSARGAFRQRGDEAKAGYVSRAIAVEGQARAGVVAERREADDRGVLTRAEMVLQDATRAAEKPLYDNGDVNDPAFIDSIMTARAAEAAKVRETLPERLRPRWDASTAADDAKAHAAALQFREQRQEEKLVANTKDILTLGSNRLLDNPDDYESTRAQVLGSLDPFPQAEEAELRPKVESQLAVSYLQGLAAQDRRDEAKAALKSGRFDKILDPDTKARMMGSLDRRTVADAMKADDVQARAESDIAAATVGGPSDRTSVAEVEKVLGVDAAAGYARGKQAGARMFGVVGPLHELSIGEIQRRMAAPAGPPLPAAKGLLAPGNIDLAHRVVVHNRDGSVSTIRSMSFEEDGREILVPLLDPSGKLMSEDQAIRRYKTTGEHLGIFKSPADATAYAKALSETQIERVAGGMRPDPKSPTYAADLKAYDAYAKAAASEIQQRQKDPAGWAMGGGDGGPTSVSDLLRGKYEAWVNAPGPEKTARFQEYVRATMARQTQAGIPPAQQRIFPVGVAGAMAADVKSSDPATRKGALERLERVLGQAGAQAGRVNRELIAAGIPAHDLEAVASAAESGNPGFMASYANATLNPKAGQALPDGKAEKALKEQVGQQTRAYLDSLAPLDPGLRRQEAVMGAVTIEARSLVLEQKMSPKDAVETAMKRYDRYVYQGHIRIPKAHEADKAFVGGGAQKALKGITGEGGKWLQEPADPRTGKPMPGAAYADTVRRGGLWVTLPDDSGVVLMLLTPAGPKPVLDDKGRRITRRWDELIKRGKGDGAIKGRSLPMG